MGSRQWRLASLIVLALAALVRLYALELNPLHHDEGVNSFFLINLVNTGKYRYDPLNYHGPTLYYLALPVAKLFGRLGFGLSTFALRLVPALFGVATVWLVLCLRRRLGAIGALTGAALVALSPGAAYMSRYFIHESLFVFFTLGLVVAALRYYDSANPVYLMLAAAAAALLFATKETAMISAGVLLIALGLSAMYARLAQPQVAKAKGRNQGPRNKRPPRDVWRTRDEGETLARFGGAAGITTWSLVAAALFLLVYVLFYSSFFTHSQGVADSLKTFEVWIRTGRRDHVHEWYTYLSWLGQEEAPLLALGAVGALAALFRPRDRFAVFAALWAFGILAAYSLIPYKTPWLALNFIVPLAIIGGYGVDVLCRSAPDDLRRRAIVPALAAAAALIIGGYQMVRLNFIHYDDDQYVYPYAHTVRDLLPLVDQINRFAARTGEGAETRISITSQDYWPLPWYLRDYKRVGYYAGRISVSNEPLVIGSETQEPELESLLGDRYSRIDSFTLRPSVNLVLYVRKDLLNP
ncbi:MAG TPA: flippase activity-associated protein Agl23 [Pyrinomonadaceae bacterium]|nr:flippase activity-associated protein Agl23 [Pyrinomonadaceae bacterium]